MTLSQHGAAAFEAALENIDGVAVSAAAPLCDYTTFKIGGPAQWLVEPETEQAVSEVVRLCAAEDVPLHVIGLGSNILVCDDGLEGVTLRFGDAMSDIAVDADAATVVAQAGATNEAIAQAACEAGLAGYEFASGIPGTVGGAAIMNAGAYDGEFKGVATQVRCIDRDGALLTLSAEEAEWGYRSSKMMHDGLLVVEATLQLTPDAREDIQARMDDLKQRREEKQPLEMPSAGSTFKRPEGYYAGKLIQDAGMQGHKVGGAQVSTKHAGFVVNAGGATAQDVLDLIAEVQAAVLEQFGVEIEPEVRLWK